MANKEDRQKQIISALEKKEQLDVDALASMFSLTPATIRRDLTELEQEGRVIRTHGGVRINSDPAVVAHQFNDRKTIMVAEKSRMASALADIIPDGASVMLDNGSSNWFVAKKLKMKNHLLVVTNSLSIMLEMSNSENDNELILAGGRYRKRNMDFVDYSVCDFLKKFYVDYAILTCDAFRPGQGFYKKSSESAMIAKTICNCASNIFVMADHTKYEARATHQFVADELVTKMFTSSDLACGPIDAPYEVVRC